MEAQDRPTVMVSSTVYRYEELLDQLFGTLNGYGYNVWMSYKGTLPVNPSKSNFDNCLKAVEDCDVFLGIITPFYGSGVAKGQPSITHREMCQAIEFDKPHYFLAHDHVPFAWRLLRQYRFLKQDGKTPNKRFRFQKTAVMDDIRVLEMYEAAIRNDLELEERKGNWVHEFFHFKDALVYVDAQFGDIDRIRGMLANGGIDHE